MINLKSIFNQVYFFMLISELVILIATGLIYLFNADQVTEKALEQKRKLNIISRNSYIEYLSKKFRIILEDELFILKTYLNIIDWGIDYKEGELNNLIFAGNITQEGPWYLNSSNYTDYLKGQYNQNDNDICNKTNLAHFNKLSEFLAKLFTKYFNWKNKTYVNIEYLYMVLNTGCFFKFPAIKSNWAQENYTPEDDIRICPNRTSDSPFNFTPIQNESIYDPRCRPFYYSSLISSDKITFTSPYKFSGGKYMSDICIRTELKNDSAPDAVLCMVINYYDLDVFREKIDEFKELTEIMLLHYKNDSSQVSQNLNMLYKNDSNDTSQNLDENDSNNTLQNLNVIYDSSYFISEFNSHMEINNSIPINFFNVYYKSILDELYSSSPDSYSEKYQELKDSDSYSKLENCIINIANHSTTDLLEIDIDNFDSSKVICPQEYTAQIIDGKIEYIDLDENIYVFPILSSYDYISDFNEFKLTKGSSNISEFFLLIRELSNSKNDEKTRFLRVAMTEIFLFLFYILSFNTFIWFVFNMIYYYIIKGLTYSLKQIRKLYLLILSQVTNTDDDIMIHKKSKLLNELGISLNNGSNDEIENDKDDSNILSNISKFINEYLIQFIHSIFQMENHVEVQQSFVTLKAIMIILLYNNPKHKTKVDKIINDNTNFTNDNKTDNYNSGLVNNNNNNKKEEGLDNSENQFISVIKFFSKCFYSKNSDKVLIDYSLVKIIIENIFISMLQEFNIQKQKFSDIPNRVFDNLLEKLIQIDEFYFMTKQAIINCHKELDIKSTYNRDNQFKNDLLLLSMLEENLNYLYSVHKCELLDSLMSYKINENINVGENIEEEEKNFLEKLQKKEKKYGKNYKLKAKNNDENINIAEKIKQNYSSIKLMEEFSLNEESKTYIQAIIKYCEDYLEIKENNRKMLKKINKNYNSNNYFSTTQNNIFTTVRTIDPFYKKKRVEEIMSEFKIIFISLEISMYHILCEEAHKSFEKFENALNRYHHFEKLVEHYKEKTKKTKSEWKLTNFTMFFINSIFYEKILVIFSFLCHKFSQYRTELFINLNILDFSPLYSLTTRRLIITKIINYIYNLRKSLIQKSSDSFATYNSLIIDENYLDIQRSINKLICLRNIISKDIKKKVLFLFDLNNKFIKDMVFKEIMFNYFKSYNEEIKTNNFEFFFCAFDHKLHFQFEPNFDECLEKGIKFAKAYCTVINNDRNKKINNMENNGKGAKLISNSNLGKTLSMTSPRKANLNNNNINNNNTINNNNLDNLEDFFDFIKNYKAQQNVDDKSNLNNQEHRADKAIYHSILFGFDNDNDMANINKFFRKNKNSKHASSYLILMTNLNSTFSKNQNNWKELTKIIYQKKVSVIIVISYDPSFDNKVELKEKIFYYKNFLKMCDGYLFIMRSLTLLKFILNAIFPIKFSKFNIDILKHYLCSTEDINHSNIKTH